VLQLAAVIFDFDGVVLDSETPEFESHRRIYERCGVALTVDEWCDQIGAWTEGKDERWATQLRERSTSAPETVAYHAEKGSSWKSCHASQCAAFATCSIR